MTRLSFAPRQQEVLGGQSGNPDSIPFSDSVVAPLIVFAAAGLILVLRWPSAVFHAEFRVEDGAVFYLGALLDGLAAIVQPYHGSLDVGPRLAAASASVVPVPLAPMVMNVMALVTTAAVAAFVAGPRMAPAIPSVRLRVAAALGLVLLPVAAQLTWSATFIGWSLAFFLVLRAIAAPPKHRTTDVLAVTIAALSSPVSILVAPLYIWRRLGPVTWVVCFAATVQVVAWATAGDRSPGAVSDPIGITQSLALGGIVAPILGRFTWSLTGTGLSILVGVGWTLAVVALLAVAATAAPRNLLVALVYASTAVAVTGVLVAPASTLDLSANSRYFLLASWSIVVVLLSAVTFGRAPQRLAAVPLLCLVGVAAVAGFRLAPQPDYNWSVKSSCIGGPSACVVPVYPGGQWDIRWPGTE